MTDIRRRRSRRRDRPGHQHDQGARGRRRPARCRPRRSVPIGQRPSATRLGRAGRRGDRRPASSTPCRQAVAAWPTGSSALALSTQRESAVVWDRRRGEPLGPVLGWQDRRTAAAARSLDASWAQDRVRSIDSGLPIDPMFSALKFAWLLDQIDPRPHARRGRRARARHRRRLARCAADRRAPASSRQRQPHAAARPRDRRLERRAARAVPRPAGGRCRTSRPPTATSAASPASPSCPPAPASTAVLGDSHAALFGHGVPRRRARSRRPTAPARR